MHSKSRVDGQANERPQQSKAPGSCTTCCCHEFLEFESARNRKPGVAFEFQTRQNLDYGQDDLERGSDFTYDIDVGNIEELNDIPNLSMYVNGGRLANGQLRNDLLWALKDEKFCQSIDCLSNPGRYPYRSLPYWVGAYFLKWLEDRKPYTLSCMVLGLSNNRL